MTRLRHTAGYISVIVAHAPTECTDKQSRKEFSTQLERVVTSCGKSDLKVVFLEISVLSPVLIDYKETLCWVPREVVPPTRIQNSCCHFFFGGGGAAILASTGYSPVLLGL